MADGKSLFEIVIAAVDKFSAPLEAMEKRVHHMTAPLRELNERIEHLAKVAGVAEIAEGFKNVGEHIAHAGEMLGEFLGPLAALGAVGSLAGLVEAAIKVSETGERIHDAAIKIGIDAESLQKLDFAGKLNSVAPEALEKGLTKLNRVLGDSAAGKNKNAAAMFQRLGIHIRDAKGHVRDAADVLPQLSDALQKNINPAVRTRIAVTALSRAGAEMLPMLVQGGEKLREWGEEAEKAGILTNEQVNQAKEFADKNQILHASIDGLVNAIGARLLPVLQPLIERATEWIQANRDLISTKIEAMVERLSEALSKIDFEKIIEGIKETVEHVGGWIARNITLKEGLLIVAGVLTGPLILAIAAIGTAIVNLGLAISATPIGLILEGIALLVLGGYELYDHWSAVKEFFVHLWDDNPMLRMLVMLTPLGQIVAAGSYLVDHWHAIRDYFSHLWDDNPMLRMLAMLTPIGQIVAAGTFVVNHWRGILDFFSHMGDQLAAPFVEAWDVIRPILDRLENTKLGRWLAQPIGRDADKADAAATALNRLGSGAAGLGGLPIRQAVNDNPDGATQAGPANDPFAARPSFLQRPIDHQGGGRLDGEVNVNVNLTGAPPGTRVTTTSKGPVAPQTSVGFNMRTAGSER